MFSETTRLGDRFELPVDILRITLLSKANTAYNYYAVLRISPVNDAMIAELVLPIAHQRPAQGQSVSFGGNG